MPINLKVTETEWTEAEQYFQVNKNASTFISTTPPIHEFVKTGVNNADIYVYPNLKEVNNEDAVFEISGFQQVKLAFSKTEGSQVVGIQEKGGGGAILVQYSTMLEDPEFFKKDYKAFEKAMEDSFQKENVAFLKYVDDFISAGPDTKKWNEEQQKLPGMLTLFLANQNPQKAPLDSLAPLRAVNHGEHAINLDSKFSDLKDMHMNEDMSPLLDKLKEGAGMVRALINVNPPKSGSVKIPVQQYLPKAKINPQDLKEIQATITKNLSQYAKENKTASIENETSSLSKIQHRLETLQKELNALTKSPGELKEIKAEVDKLSREYSEIVKNKESKAQSEKLK